MAAVYMMTGQLQLKYPLLNIEVQKKILITLQKGYGTLTRPSAHGLQSPRPTYL